MDGRQRVAMAMRHQEPDRVPVMCQLALGHYFLHARRRPSEIWFDSGVFAETLSEFRARYQFDGVLVNIPGRPSNWRDYLAEHRTRDGEEVLRWNNGLETHVPADDNPWTRAANGSPLRRADYRTVEVSDPGTFRIPGYVWNIWHAPSLWDIAPDADLSVSDTYPEWFTLALRATRALCPDVSVHVEVFSPFTHLLELLGYDQALLALIDVPDTCISLLERFTEFAATEVHLYADCDPDAILISSAFAGAGFISREMYRRFVLPFEADVANVIRSRGLPSYTHTCGAIGDRLDLMAETKVDGIDTLDPPPLGTVDLASAKREFGGRFFFKGNLDAVNEMLRADDTAFEEAVRRRLEIGMPGGGYILSSACSVAPRVVPERLARMVELAKAFRRYEG
ncbi:MAG: uroporphyrinogen decarboxylase family protein [Planctomycetota bacterium]